MSEARKKEIEILVTSLGPMGQEWTIEKAREDALARLRGIRSLAKLEDMDFVISVLVDLIQQSTDVDFRGPTKLSPLPPSQIFSLRRTG